MQRQPSEIQIPPPSSSPPNPPMPRPLTSKYGTPLTFNMAVMFLFYVLSVTLCLSSVSTCVCVIFNPVGTFVTITNYLAYVLMLAGFLTISFVGLLALGFDDKNSRESPWRIMENEGEKPVEREHGEVCAQRETDDAMPIHEGSASKKSRFGFEESVPCVRRRHWSKAGDG